MCCLLRASAKSTLATETCCLYRKILTQRVSVVFETEKSSFSPNSCSRGVMILVSAVHVRVFVCIGLVRDNDAVTRLISREHAKHTTVINGRIIHLEFSNVTSYQHQMPLRVAVSQIGTVRSTPVAINAIYLSSYLSSASRVICSGPGDINVVYCSSLGEARARVSCWSHTTTGTRLWPYILHVRLHTPEKGFPSLRLRCVLPDPGGADCFVGSSFLAHLPTVLHRSHSSSSGPVTGRGSRLERNFMLR